MHCCIVASKGDDGGVPTAVVSTPLQEPQTEQVRYRAKRVNAIAFTFKPVSGKVSLAELYAFRSTRLQQEILSSLHTSKWE